MNVNMSLLLYVSHYITGTVQEFVEKVASGFQRIRLELE